MPGVRRITPLFVVALAELVGCGTSSGGTRVSPPVQARPPRTCTVHGRSVTLQDLVIAAPGTLDEATLSVAAMPVDIVLPPCAGTPPDLGPKISTFAEPPPTPMGAPTITLEAPVAAKATRGNVWMWLTADITSRDGAVTAKRGAALFDGCVRDDRVVAAAILDPDEVEVGAPVPGKEYVSFVDVPCDALTLDRATDHDQDVGVIAPTEGTYWQLAGDASQIALHVVPEPGAPSHDLVTPNAQGGIYVRELEQHGAWLHVEADGGGVTARGWVKASAFTRLEARPLGAASCDCAAPQEGFGTIGSPAPIHRAVTVPAGTVVYWRPPGPHELWTRAFGEAGARWGTFVAETPVVVLDRAGANAIQLSSVPGLVPSSSSPSALPLWLRRGDIEGPLRAPADSH